MIDLGIVEVRRTSATEWTVLLRPEEPNQPPVEFTVAVSGEGWNAPTCCDSPCVVLCARCESCADCCDGGYCEGCDSIQHADDSEYMCGTCERCIGICCTCSMCTRCLDRFAPGDICISCDYCEGCECRCEPDEPDDDDDDVQVRTVARGIVFYAAKLTERKRIPSPRFVGVEIEMEKSGNNYDRIASWCRTWDGSLVTDGSLPSTGREAVTSPAAGDVLANMLTEFSAAADADRARVSDGCGLHIHIDARDFTFYDMRRLVKLYAILEAALFTTQPSQRRNSTYCSPCGAALLEAIRTTAIPKESKQALILGVYGHRNGTKNAGLQFATRRRSKYDSARYFALNLHSWYYRGTVEVRLHSATTRAYKIIPWAALWAKILDVAHAMTEPQIDELLDAWERVNTSDAFSRRLLYWLAPTAESREYLVNRWRRFNADGWLPQGEA